METIILLLMIYLLINSKKVNYYVIDPIPFFAIRIIASIWLSSHSLVCEIGCRGQVRTLVNPCTFVIKQVCEFEYSQFVYTMLHTLSNRVQFSLSQATLCAFKYFVTFHQYNSRTSRSSLQQLCVSHSVLWAIYSPHVDDKDTTTSVSISSSFFV